MDFYCPLSQLELGHGVGGWEVGRNQDVGEVRQWRQDLNSNPHHRETHHHTASPSHSTAFPGSKMEARLPFPPQTFPFPSFPPPSLLSQTSAHTFPPPHHSGLRPMKGAPDTPDFVNSAFGSLYLRQFSELPLCNDELIPETCREKPAAHTSAGEQDRVLPSEVSSSSLGAANSGSCVRSLGCQLPHHGPPVREMRPRRAATPGSGLRAAQRMFLWLFTPLFFHKEPTTLHSSFQICSSSCEEINDAFWTFQMQRVWRLAFFFFALSLFPLSQLKKMLAEVRTHNGQACVTDQLPPTPRPVDKSSFVHCILGGTPWVCPGPARECSANFFPNRSHGSGPGSGPSCANPRPDKNQRKKDGECPPKEPSYYTRSGLKS